MGGCASKRKDVDGEAPGAPQGNLPVTPDAVEAIEVPVEPEIKEKEPTPGAEESEERWKMAGMTEVHNGHAACHTCTAYSTKRSSPTSLPV
ncbi:hypothetical protein C4D60_Mb01t19230 [Musa balbisiana]|uniref:Uncharacterized protein n=1 Tax=Musa balbisiana TaxID=52838 RepID=A0A4S8JNJ6_MUSBA|nr:hypothetical protein C4D60_Mb01t19230 [Musa balbisiana]